VAKAIEKGSSGLRIKVLFVFADAFFSGGTGENRAK
jgi:hypothetical protein